MASNFFQFLKSKTFFINVGVLLVLFIASFFILTALLSSFTHHGENIPVPDLKGQKLSALDNILSPHNFHYKVVDSLYDSEKKPGTVLDQDPAPKSKVKESRTIYLTINATQPPDVKMPDLVDVSFRQAEAILQSFGLVTGEIIYRADLAKNAVLEQRYKNRVIRPGTMIPKGSEIDLVLGDGMGEGEINVPDLTGMSKIEAWSALKRASLNLGEVHYDKGDSFSARVYRQSPSFEDDIILKPGDAIEIYLK